MALNKLSFADIFSGCGGLSYGFYTNPTYKGLLAVDHSESAGLVFEVNHPKMKFKIRDLFEENQIDKVINELKNNCDVLLGGPPCQGFSTMGKRRADDKRNTLIEAYLKIVAGIKPKIVIIENVKGIQSMRHFSGELYPEFIKNNLQNNCSPKYETSTLLINTQEFGLAQTRTRFLFIAVRDDVNEGGETMQSILDGIMSQRVNKRNNLRNVIGDLPSIESGEGAEEFEMIRNGIKSKIYNHKAMNHSKKLIDRFKHVPPGGGLLDVPPEILTPHLRKMVEGEYGSGGHVKNIYGRLEWEKLCGTIVAGIDKITCGRFLHPIANRLLTPRECARIQSFPDNFKFLGGTVAQYYMIGNAVPPKISSVLANAISDAFQTKIKTNDYKHMRVVGL